MKEKNLGDITKIKIEDIPDCDIITHGSPCFRAGTLITTRKGLIPIEEIKEGDMILTHKLRFKKVVKTIVTNTNKIYELKAKDILTTYVTEEHPYYIRKIFKTKNGEINYTEPKWEKVGKLKKGDFIGIPLLEAKGKKDEIIIDNILWKPFISKELLDTNEDVYNFEVTDDNSYVANNCIVHNCQDFSVAGNGKGGDAGTNTRSSLMWHTVNIVEHKLPKIVIWENVKGVLSKKHKHNFDKYLEKMDILGYNNYYQVLNAKNYGIPQNRERIFVVSVRKDIDNELFEFPKPFDNGLRLKHMLEDNVAEKYYINEERCENLLKELKEKETSDLVRAECKSSTNRHQWDLVVKKVKNKNQDISYCIDANYAKGTTVNDFLKKSRRQLVVVTSGEPSKNEITKINNSKRFSQKEMLKEKQRTGKLLVIGNTVPSNHTTGRVFNTDGISPTVMYRNSKVVQILEEQNELEVRPCLTPDREKKRQNGRRFKENDEPMFTLTANDRHGVIIKESCVLRKERTEYGKKVRKEYELGELKENISGMVSLHPRKDGVSNTITTVQKDNLLLVSNECKQALNISKKILNDNERQKRTDYPDEISPTVLARNDNAKLLQVGMLDMKGNEQIRRVYDLKGIAPTINTCSGGHREPKIVCKEDDMRKNNELIFLGGITEKDWAKNGKNFSRNFPQGERVYDSNGIACSQTAQGGGTRSYTGLYLEKAENPKSIVNYRIRKLTPLECWRLMGFDDEDYWKARRALEEKYYNGKDRSNSQMYKQSGNSIVVNVLEGIFLELQKQGLLFNDRDNDPNIF